MIFKPPPGVQLVSLQASSEQRGKDSQGRALLRRGKKSMLHQLLSAKGLVKVEASDEEEEDDKSIGGGRKSEEEGSPPPTASLKSGPEPG